MKRGLAFVLSWAIMICLIGCCLNGDAHADIFGIGEDRFECIYSKGYDRIIVDTETGVMYLAEMSGYGHAITLMVDETGMPLLWEAE